MKTYIVIALLLAGYGIMDNGETAFGLIAAGVSSAMFCIGLASLGHEYDSDYCHLDKAWGDISDPAKWDWK